MTLVVDVMPFEATRRPRIDFLFVEIPMRRMTKSGGETVTTQLHIIVRACDDVISLDYEIGHDEVVSRWRWEASEWDAVQGTPLELVCTPKRASLKSCRGRTKLYLQNTRVQLDTFGPEAVYLTGFVVVLTLDTLLI